MGIGERFQLIKQAAGLVVLGIRMENARKKLRRLSERGVALRDKRMLALLDRFTEAQKAWESLESRHLALRSKWGQR